MNTEKAHAIIECGESQSAEFLEAKQFIIDNYGEEKFRCIYECLVVKAPPAQEKSMTRLLWEFLRDMGPHTAMELSDKLGYKKISVSRALSANNEFIRISGGRYWRARIDGR